MTPLALVALAGLATGSFLNVVIHRLPRGQSIVRPRSACPHCGRPIRWHDNVPILGWLLLRGRCRDCRAPISIVYPLVEAATLVVFLLTFRRFGWEPLLVPRLALAAALVALFVIDLRHQILPDRITLTGIGAGLGFSVAFPPGLRDALIGAAAGYALLWALAEAWYALKRQQAMGGGDLKMLAMIGAFVGWRAMLVAFALSIVLGGLAAAVLLAIGRVGWGSKLPYGCFLAIGGLVAALYGEEMLAWYLSMYR